MFSVAKGLSGLPLNYLGMVLKVDPVPIASCLLVGSSARPKVSFFILTPRLDMANRVTSKALRESQVLSQAHYLLT